MFAETPGAAAALGELRARLEAVETHLRGQQLCMDTVIEKCATLGEDALALRDCLRVSGFVSTDLFLARKHRHHFAQMLQRYPCSLFASLENVAASRERIIALAEFVGKNTVASLAACSRVTDSGVACSAHELACTLPPMVYVAGGEDDDGSALADVERLCPSTGVWEPCAPLPFPRKWCAATATAGRIFVLGGWGVNGEALSAVDRFDPWLTAWEAMPSMQSRRGAVAAAAVGSTLWAIGGQDGSMVLHSSEVLDLANGAWAALPDMLCARTAASAVCMRGCVYAIGGQSASREALRWVERFDAGGTAAGCYASAWAAAPALRTARVGLAAAATGGHIYAVGGRDSSGKELRSLERIGADGIVWEELTPMCVPRWGLGAAVCAGRLFALGGTDRAEDASIGACERYWPSVGVGDEGGIAKSPRGGTDTWAFTGCLKLPRRLFGATASR